MLLLDFYETLINACIYKIIGYVSRHFAESHVLFLWLLDFIIL